MMNNQTPKKEMFFDALEIFEKDGFWYSTAIAGSMKAFKANFKPNRDNVVVLASVPKTGTTWLKALSHSILFRGGEEEEDALATLNPHHCVPTFENTLYFEDESVPRSSDPDECRLFHTHLPYSYLPDTIKSGSGGGCKLVYVARNPKDTLISLWHFYNKMLLDGGEFPLERAVDSFCSGEMPMGPYWDHVLEYWNQSMVSPDKVMFVKYEDLQRDTNKHVRELAAFLGRPFSGEGEDEEEVDKVVWRSSFERLKGLEVNKTGQPNPVLSPRLMNSHLFRRGEVGDWRNYLTVEMGRRVDDVTRMKFEGSGLSFGDEVDVAN
ncbi:Cytosolic sulfotransferase 5 [Linum perenne]